MLCFPNCKINIGLYITSRRADGYHNLETVFYPVPFTDALEIVPAATTQLHTTGLPVAGNTTDNLVMKAYHLLAASFPDQVLPVAIHLLKSIPMGAGLGGGSADAAFMLRLMNTYFHLGLDAAALKAYALQLGSDCPFFIGNSPAYGTGRGEQLTPVSLDLSGCSIQLVCPAVHVSTRDAFAMLTPKAAPFDLRQLPQLPLSEWPLYISNDFEAAVFAKHPALKEIKEQLYAGGALYAAMSGSGSAIYGIFPKGQRASITADVAFTEVYV